MFMDADRAFFGAYALRLKVEILDQQHWEFMFPGVGYTAGTNGKFLWANPEFINSLTTEELMGLIEHEIWHLLGKHHLRQGNRNPREWNYSCDAAINPLIVKAGRTLPDGGVWEESAITRKHGMIATVMNAEQIHHALYGNKPPSEEPPETPPGDDEGDDEGQGNPGNAGADGDPCDDGDKSDGDDQGEGQGEGDGDDQGEGQGEGQGPQPGEWGQIMSATEGMDDDEIYQAEQDHMLMIDEIIKATEATIGRVPGGVLEVVEAEHNVKENWRASLARFVRDRCADDWTYRRPNRRAVHTGLYRPSRFSETIGELVIAVDTSGSVSTEELEQFGAEIQSIVDDVKPSAVHLVKCHSRVWETSEYGPGDEIDWGRMVRGGTEFKPVFKWVEQQNIDPVCLIYLSDLEVCLDDYPKEPDYPVLWVVNGPFRESGYSWCPRPPFGELIEMI